MDDELLMTVHNNDGYGIDMQRIERIRQLLAEVKQLREIVQAMGSGRVPPCNVIDGDCHFYGDCYPEWMILTPPPNETGYWRHHPACPITKARAILEK